MTATYSNAIFQKGSGSTLVKVTVYVPPDYKENYTRGTLKKVPSPITGNDRITDPTDSNYGLQDKPSTIDLGMAPERRLTVNGYLLNGTSDGDSYGGTTLEYAMDKKNALIRMFMSGGNVTLTLETGSIVFTPFVTVYVDKFEFAKMANDAVTSAGVSTNPSNVAEYSCVISMEDSTEYGT